VSKFDASVYLKSLYDASQGVRESDVFLSIFTEEAKIAPETLLQIGIAVVHDKPIGLLVHEDTPVSEHLKKIAFGIERFSTQEDIHEATKRLLSKKPT
jgi:hypothetical protein